MHRILILCSLLGISALATDASSVALPLGPETPLSIPAVRSAPYEQHLAGIASNGWDFLALWLDRRSTVPANPDAYAPAPLYVSRVDRSSRLSTPFGLPLPANAVHAALVRTLAGYAVVWSEKEEVNSMFLDDDGAPIGVPKRISDGFLAGAASNGRTIFVIHGTFAQPQFASVFSIDGTLLSRVALDGADRYPQAIRPVIMPNGDYGFLTHRWICPGTAGCSVMVTFITVSESGLVHAAPLELLSTWSQSAVAVGNGRLLLAWMTDNIVGPARKAGFRMFDLSGNPLTAEREIAATNQVQAISGAFAPSAGWDGENFLVAWQWPLAASERVGEIRALRVSSDGIVLDGSPEVLAPTLGMPPWFASNDSRQLVAWDTLLNFQSSDLALRSAARFDTLPDAATTSMPDSAALQTEVQMSRLGSSTLAVWREGDTDPSIVASLTGRASVVIAPAGILDLQAPATGASKDQYLVVWREQAPESNPQPLQTLRILGKRVAADGTVLDGEPIVIAQESALFGWGAPASNTLAVASDGTGFFVVWPAAENSLHGRRVSSAGIVIDSAPIDISLPLNGTAGSPRVVWSGQQYIVAWTADPSCKVCGRPPDPPHSQIYSARVSAAGTLIASRKIWSGGYGSRVGLAQAADGSMLLAWGIADSLDAGAGCVYTMPLDRDGAPAGSAHTVSCTAPSIWPLQFPDLDIAWDGLNYAVAWTQVDSHAAFVRAMRISPSGALIDGEPFAVAPDDSISFQPALVTTPAGVLIAYDRIGTEPQYGSVARLFSRAVPRSTSPLRKRTLH